MLVIIAVYDETMETFAAKTKDKQQQETKKHRLTVSTLVQIKSAARTNFTDTRASVLPVKTLDWDLPLDWGRVDGRLV
eukprot:scaffold4459_cov92-Amphora_coffeaeformis.AAC.1